MHRVRKGHFAGRDYGEFVLQDGVCPLLRDGICSLQREKGASVLPKVCRVFPRLEDYAPSGYYERSLTVACEGVLDLLWNLPEGIDFVSDPLPREAWRNWETPEGCLLLPWFQDIRSVCIDILQSRHTPLPERIFTMGMALRELAEGEADIPRWLERTAVLREQVKEERFLRRDRNSLSLFLAHNANILYVLTRSGKRQMQALMDALDLERDPESGQITISGGAYLKAEARFQESLGAQDWFWENLMVALFYGWRLPDCNSPELLWHSYVNFCNLYSVYRFLSVMSCREGAAGDRNELFRLLVLVSRALIHSSGALNTLGDWLYRNDSVSLAHMAILLEG